MALSGGVIVGADALAAWLREGPKKDGHSGAAAALLCGATATGKSELIRAALGAARRAPASVETVDCAHGTLRDDLMGGWRVHTDPAVAAAAADSAPYLRYEWGPVARALACGGVLVLENINAAPLALLQQLELILETGEVHALPQHAAWTDQVDIARPLRPVPVPASARVIGTSRQLPEEAVPRSLAQRMRLAAVTVDKIVPFLAGPARGAWTEAKAAGVYNQRIVYAASPPPGTALSVAPPHDACGGPLFVQLYALGSLPSSVTGGLTAARLDVAIAFDGGNGKTVIKGFSHTTNGPAAGWRLLGGGPWLFRGRGAEGVTVTAVDHGGKFAAMACAVRFLSTDPTLDLLGQNPWVREMVHTGTGASAAVQQLATLHAGMAQVESVTARQLLQVATAVALDLEPASNDLGRASVLDRRPPGQTGAASSGLYGAALTVYGGRAITEPDRKVLVTRLGALPGAPATAVGSYGAVALLERPGRGAWCRDHIALVDVVPVKTSADVAVPDFFIVTASLRETTVTPAVKMRRIVHVTELREATGQAAAAPAAAAPTPVAWSALLRAATDNDASAAQTSALTFLGFEKAVAQAVSVMVLDRLTGAWRSDPWVHSRLTGTRSRAALFEGSLLLTLDDQNASMRGSILRLSAGAGVAPLPWHVAHWDLANGAVEQTLLRAIRYRLPVTITGGNRGVVCFLAALAGQLCDDPVLSTGAGGVKRIIVSDALDAQTLAELLPTESDESAMAPPLGPLPWLVVELAQAVPAALARLCTLADDLTARRRRRAQPQQLFVLLPDRELTTEAGSLVQVLLSRCVAVDAGPLERSYSQEAVAMVAEAIGAAANDVADIDLRLVDTMKSGGGMDSKPAPAPAPAAGPAAAAAAAATKMSVAVLTKLRAKQYDAFPSDTVLLGSAGVAALVSTAPTDAKQTYMVEPSSQRARDVRTIATLVLAKVPILLEGPAATGKTSLIRRLSQLKGIPLVEVANSAGTTLDDYVGGAAPDPSKPQGIGFVRGPLVRAMEDGFWFLADELNLAPTGVLWSLLPALEDMPGPVYIPGVPSPITRHPNFRFFATQNPVGYVGRRPLPARIRACLHQINFDTYDTKFLRCIIERQLLVGTGLGSTLGVADGILEAFLQINGTLQRDAGHQRLQLTLRDLVKWSRRCRPLPLTDAGAAAQRAVQAGALLLLPRYTDDAELATTVATVLGKSFRGRTGGTAPIPLPTHSDAVRACIAAREPILLFGPSGRKSHELQAALSSAVLRHMYCGQATEVEGLIGQLVLLTPAQCRQVLERTWQRVCSVGANVYGRSLNADRAKLLAANSASVSAREPNLELLVARLQRLNDGAVDAAPAASAAGGPGTVGVGSGTATASRAGAGQRSIHFVDGVVTSTILEGGQLVLRGLDGAPRTLVERLNGILDVEPTFILTEDTVSLRATALNQALTIPTNLVLAATASGADAAARGRGGLRQLSPALRSRFTEVFVPMYTVAELERIVVHAVGDNELLASARKLTLLDRLLAQDGPIGSNVRALLRWTRYAAGVRAMGVDPELSVAWATLVVACNGSMERLRAFWPTTEIIPLPDPFDPKAVGTAAPVIVPGTANGRGVLRLPYLGLAAQTAPTAPAVSATAGSVRFPLQWQPQTAFMVAHVVSALSQPRPRLLFVSAPGTGKTSVVQTCAAMLGYECVTICLSRSLSVDDLLGYGGLVEGTIVSAIRRRAWVLLDELNLASPEVLDALLPLLDSAAATFAVTGAEEPVSLDGSVIIAAMNPETIRGGRSKLPAPVLGTFAVVHVPAPSWRQVWQVAAATIALPEGSEAKAVFATIVHDLQTAMAPLTKPAPSFRDAFKIVQLIATSITVVAQAEHIRLLAALALAVIYDPGALGRAPWLPPSLQLNRFKVFLADAPVRFTLAQERAAANGGTSVTLQLPGHAGAQPSANMVAAVNTWLSPTYRLLLMQMSVAIAAHLPILIEGPANSGKTFVATLLASLLGPAGRPLVVLPMHAEMTSGELLAYTLLLRDRQAGRRTASIWSPILRAMRDGHWVLIENVQAAPQEVFERLNPLLEPGRRDTFELHEVQANVAIHPDFRVLLTAATGVRGSNELSAALRDRCVNVSTVSLAQASAETLLSMLCFQAACRAPAGTPIHDILDAARAALTADPHSGAAGNLRALATGLTSHH